MNDQVKTDDKLKFWQQKLKDLEEIELPKAMLRIGESADDGDWHENAEYEDAVNLKQRLEVQIKELKLLISKLSKK